ncbi:MAG TPA: methyltransferase domain-containing protein [Nitrospira sp.]|nr:methyltransferase domain-containing protein [Nitrospira sp.]
MSIPESPLNILLINEHPDELKLVTSSLRGFFSGCRIEAGFSSEEALTFSQRDEWQIILIDQELSPDSGLDILARVRRNAPYAAIILQTTQSDSQTAVQALQNGADFLLFKNSPGFVTELLFSAQEAIEKRDLQLKLDRTFQRHLRLMETVSDLLYELDQDGRFVYVGASADIMLGYNPEELAGQHYSILLPPLQQAFGRFRLNERRTGSRSVRKFELALHRKALPNVPPVVTYVEVTAKGLFDNARRYIGTVGLLRDLSPERSQQERLTQLETKLRETDRQLTLSQEAARVSRQLQKPLTTLLQDSQRLLNAIQHSQFEQHVETMVAQASQASQLSHQLTQVIHGGSWEGEPLYLNEILQEIVQSIQRDSQGQESPIATHFAQDLPVIVGSRAAIIDLARILLNYAQRCASGPLSSSHLALRTASLTVPERVALSDRPTYSPQILDTYASILIQEVITDTISGSAMRQGTIAPEEFLRAHQIVQAHGGAIEIERPAGGGLSIKVRLPAVVLSASSSPEKTSLALARPTQAVNVNQSRPAGERRQYERRLLSLPAELTIGNSTLRGVLRNMSTRGALLTVRELSLSLHLQPAYVVIKTPVSFLEIQGIVHERPSAESALQPVTNIAISFMLTNEREQDLLQSFMDGLQDGSTIVTFEVLILSPSQAADAGSENARMHESVSLDRRETIRLVAACQFRLMGSDQRSDRPLGMIVNLSRNGACLEISGAREIPSSQQIIQLIPVMPIAHLSASRVEDSNTPWRARVIWKNVRRVQPTTPVKSREEPLRIGVRFEHLSTAQEHRLQNILMPTLRASFDFAEPMFDSPISTVSHTLRNRNGHLLALSHDSPTPIQSKTLPIVLLPSGYGMTQHAYLTFAYCLAGSGLRVLRYDHSNHIGLSDGDPLQTTLTSLEDDLDTVLAYARKEWPGSSFTILASDLLARVALRRRDWHRLIRRLILLNPTLDLRQTLIALHGRDIIQEYLGGSRFGRGNLLGLTLDIDRFLSDAVAAQYTDATTLQQDLAHCETNIVFITSGSEVQPSIPSPAPMIFEEAIRLLGGKSTRLNLPSSLLTVGPIAPNSLRGSWERLRQLCQVSDSSAPISPAALPAISRATSIRSRFERDQLRARYTIGAEANEPLWTVQTDLTQSFDEVPAYWQYIDQLYQLLQPLDGGLALLDIGCGIHSFARILLLNLSYRLRAQTWRHNRPLQYIGMDISASAIRKAQTATQDALKHVDSLFSGRISGPSPLAQSWVQGEYAESLPFADHSFDRIVANLSLSFASSPLHAMEELFRVLRPGGKLVLSAFTPLADMALVYRPTLRELGLDTFTEEARITMNRMAQCSAAIRVGQLNVFEEDTLGERLSQFTSVPSRLLRTLSGHVVLAAAEKPDSSS